MRNKETFSFWSKVRVKCNKTLYCKLFQLYTRADYCLLNFIISFIAKSKHKHILILVYLIHNIFWKANLITCFQWATTQSIVISQYIMQVYLSVKCFTEWVKEEENMVCDNYHHSQDVLKCIFKHLYRNINFENTAI